MNRDTAIAVGLLAFSAAVFLAKLFVDRYLSHAFTKRLDRHKNELQLLANQASHENAMKLQTYGLFVTKRHEVYAQLYSQLRSVANRVWQLRNRRFWPTFEWADEGEVVRQIEAVEFPAKAREAILAAFRDDWRVADEVFRTQMEAYGHQRARRVLSETASHYYSNAIYVSPEIGSQVDALISLLGALVNDVSNEVAGGGRLREWPKEAEVLAMLTKIESEMQLELSGSASGVAQTRSLTQS